jgi:hypothetical protein
MILVAYRHGLWATEVCDLQWQQIELSEGRLHVHRVKNGTPCVHRIRRDTRCGLFVSYDAITVQMLTYSFPSAVLTLTYNASRVVSASIYHRDIEIER